MSFLNLLRWSRPASHAGFPERPDLSAASRKHRRKDIDFKPRLEILEDRIALAIQILPPPIITWSTPAPITYGTALGPTQLDATVTLLEYDANDNAVNIPPDLLGLYPVTLIYTLADGTTPASGAVLPVGLNEALNVTVIPDGNFAFGTIAGAEFTGFVISTDSVNITVIPADNLVVTKQPPANVLAGTPFDVQVSAEDANGNVDPKLAGPVTIALSDNPGNATLGGTLTVSAVNGVADFGDLTLNQPGTGYTLQVTGDNLTPITTDLFDVADIQLTEATETDACHIALNYTILGGTLSDPVTFDVYRSAEADAYDDSDLVGTVTISNPGDLTMGCHTNVVLPVSNGGVGGALAINPSEEYVDVVYTPFAGDTNPDHEVDFRKFVLGVVTQGFELFGKAPDWLINPNGGPGSIPTALQEEGYNDVIAFDWSAVSNSNSGKVIRDASASLAKDVKTAADDLVLQQGVPGSDVVDLQFIGHSRGAVLVNLAMTDLNDPNDPALRYERPGIGR